ncbi:MAG: hypothetical protein ACFFAS_07555 [Promethearchaeota archaeon]
MKKISFGLDVGLVGSSNSFNESFFEYLKKLSIPSSSSSETPSKNKVFNVFIVFNGVPIKIRVHLAKNFEDIIYMSDKINKIDVLILVLDVYDLTSKDQYKPKDIKEIIEVFSFKGTSVLLGIDTKKIEKEDDFDGFRISRYDLVQKTKELDLLYCFEIQNKNKDIKDFFEIILSDHVFKFAITNPELLEQSKIYGTHLMEMRQGER